MASTNLPLQLTSFIGRQAELQAVEQLLSTSRLVTLTGPGGSGKTRLALQIVSQISHSYEDARLVELAPLHEPALVPQFVAQALGLQPTPESPPLELLLNFINTKQLLLILDNCEHLADACAELILALLSQTPNLHILATSREALAIAGESISPVFGLAYPTVSKEAGRDGQSYIDPQALLVFDAVNLFVERGRAISHQFCVTPENASAIVEVCRRLDGMPLALELASARLNVLTIQEIASRLNDRFTLLTAETRRGIDPRHHTLQAAIDWSYDLLKDNEQALLRRMAVFSAGCTLDMLEAFYAGELQPGETSLNLISSLVNKSLVVAETTGGAQIRYRLLETIRQYLLEKLEEAGEAEAWRDLHLDLFLARTEEAAPKLGGDYQQLWLNWLEDEYDNIRAALAWSLESSPESALGRRRLEAGLRIASALPSFWQIRGSLQEGLVWFERLLAKVDDRFSPVIRANAITFAAMAAWFIGEGQKSLDLGREAVRVAEAAGDEGKPALPFALAGLSTGAKAAGDFLTAFETGERVLQLFRESGPPLYIGNALLSQGEIALQLGNYDLARERWSESLTLAQDNGDAFRSAYSLDMLGDLARLEGNYSEAGNRYEQSERLYRELNAQHELPSALCNRGFFFLHQRQVGRARVLFSESLVINLKQKNKQRMTDSLIGLAATAILAGLPGPGARLLSASCTISGLPKGSTWPPTQMEFDHYQNLVQTALSGADLQDEQNLGSAMTLEQAVDYALNLPSPTESPTSSIQDQNELTRREGEIAVLIAQGKSNSEIASELVLSKRTVETHASHILSKLGLSSRAQIVRWVLDHGLAKDPTG
jgi:predicted ATPase/DNA-binding CsgD family transcriptional regulator